MEAATVMSYVAMAEAAMPAAVALTTTTALSAALWWYVYPELAWQYMQHLALYMAGMKVKTVRVRGMNICYAERGQRSAESGPSMLFVHGFSVSKDMWLPLIPLLPRSQHILMLDLPGHGASDIPDDDMDIHIPGMVEFLHEFVEEIELNKEKFHIIGLSMGGAISGLYGAAYPQDVCMVTSCCPAILTPTESQFMHDVRSGDCSTLNPTNVEECRKLFAKSCKNSWALSGNVPILALFMAARKNRQPFYEKLFSVMTGDMDEVSKVLMSKLFSIEVKCQVLWGHDDEILDVSGAELLRGALPECRVDLLEECGHVIPYDKPFKMVDLLLEFRGETWKKNRFFIM